MVKKDKYKGMTMTKTNSVTWRGMTKKQKVEISVENMTGWQAADMVSKLRDSLINNNSFFDNLINDYFKDALNKERNEKLKKINLINDK